MPLGRFRLVDRHAGLGFSPGGYYHPRSRLSERASDLGVISNYIKTFDFWEREIREKKIDVVLNGLYFEYYPAMANGGALRSALSSRNENYYFWSDSCRGGIEQLAETFAKTKVPETEIGLLDAPVLNRKSLDKIVEDAKFSVLLKKTGKLFIRHAYNSYKYSKTRQYYLRSDLAYIYRSWRTLRRLYKMKAPTIEELANRRYVFYALQVEPESNFQGYSPEYFYQLPAIISLARDLPAGVTLVVKEHLPAAGRRPDLFYEQIGLLKNVVMADVRESGLELVRNAAAVATINGTVGQEAAVMGKPVLSFGRHNLYNILPHVRVIGKEEDLYPALLWALSDDFDELKAKADGQRYLQALRTHSFDMADFGFHNPLGYGQKSVEQAGEQLLKSLGQNALSSAIQAG